MIKVNDQIVEHGDDRVLEVVQMGKSLGFTFKEWYAIVKTASIRMECAFQKYGRNIQIEVECQCPRCVSARSKPNLTVVPNAGNEVIN